MRYTHKEMKKIVLDSIDGMRIGEPVLHEAFRVFPLIAKQPQAAVEDRTQLKTVKEALEEGFLLIQETGTVGHLLFVNQSKEHKILVLAGEIVKGGAQNRVVNVNLIIDEGATVQVPTSCVEMGRWDRFDAPFTTAEHKVSPSVFSELNRSVTWNLRYSGGQARYSDQRGIWDKVEETLSDSDAQNPTSDLGALFMKKDRETYETLHSVLKNLRAQGAVGVLAESDGRWIAEINDSEEIARVHIPKALESFMVEALQSTRRPVDEEKVRSRNMGDPTRILESLSKGPFEPFDSGPDALEIRLDRKDAGGSGLIYSGRLVHLSVAGGAA